MAITPILNSNVEKDIQEQLGDKYYNIELVSKVADAVSTVADAISHNVDFDTLAKVLNSLDTLSAEALIALSQANLVSMSDDLEKGNYLGSRKIDIDLSLNIGSDNEPIYYKQANIITVDGIRIEYPFYTIGTTTISETTSPSIILQHIKDAIAKYNAESDPSIQVLNTEFDLLNEVDISKPTVIRIRDVDGKASGISRIELIRNASSVIDNYFWAKTTSALQTLADRVGDLISLGNNITDIITLAAKSDELSYLYDNKDALTGTTDSLYSELSKLQALYNALDKLVFVADDLSNIDDVQEHIAQIDAVQGKLSEITSTSSKLIQISNVSDNIASVVSVYEDIIKGAGTNSSSDSSILNALNNAADALQAKIDAVNAKTDAESRATEAATHSASAADSATLAEQYASTAEADKNITSGLKDQTRSYLEQITGLTAEATTLTSSAPAYASYNSSNGKLTIGVPQGKKGDRGDAFKVDAVGTYSDKSSYNVQPSGYSFLSTNGYGPQPDEVVGTNYEGQLTISAGSELLWDANLVYGQDYEVIVNISSLTNGSLSLFNGTDLIKTYSAEAEVVTKFYSSSSKLDLKADASFDGVLTISIKKVKDNGSLVFFKTSDTDGDYWSIGSPFGKGDKGDKGDGVVSVDFVSTTDPSGQPGRLNATDTYKVVFSDGSFDSIIVNNGKGTTVLDCKNDTLVTMAPTTAMCDTRVIQQKDNISNIVVEQGSDYSVDINGETVTYTSDPYINDTYSLDNIVVADNTDYGVDIIINGTTTNVTYTSDPAIAQVDKIDVINVINNTLYDFLLNGTSIEYTSDPAVAQVNTLTQVIVDNSTAYTVTIDGSDVTYTSQAAVAQVDQIDTITVADNTTYAYTVEGNEVSYTSGTSATESEIIQGLVDAANNDATVGSIVTASVVSGGLQLTADTAGDPFVTTITSGTMSLSTVVNNDKATASEIYNGLKNAINAAGLNVTSGSITEGINVVSKTPGVPFTLAVATSNLTNTIIVENNNATIDEILDGLKNAVNASSEPIDATVVSNQIVLTAHVAGVPFTTSTSNVNISISNTTPNNNATLSEIIDGLVSAINSAAIGVTASNKTSYLIVVSDDHAISYTLSVTSSNMIATEVSANDATLAEILSGLAAAIGSNSSVNAVVSGDTIDVSASVPGVNYTLSVSAGQMSITSTQTGQPGISILSLIQNPVIGDMVTVVDAVGNFATNNLTVTAGTNGLIQGSTGDLVIDVDGVKVDFVYSGNDWRFM